MVSSDLGFDFTSLYNQTKQAGTELIKELPGQLKTTATNALTAKVGQVATPVAQQIATEKTQRAVSKGNVALYSAGGVALGALVAGGGMGRRAIGGLAVGLAASLVAFKMGLLYDSM